LNSSRLSPNARAITSRNFPVPAAHLSFISKISDLSLVVQQNRFCILAAHIQDTLYLRIKTVGAQSNRLDLSDDVDTENVAALQVVRNVLRPRDRPFTMREVLGRSA